MNDSTLRDRSLGCGAVRVITLTGDQRKASESARSSHWATVALGFASTRSSGVAEGAPYTGGKAFGGAITIGTEAEVDR